MLPITHARRLVDRGETAETWGHPDTDVITTTTIADEKLARLSFEVERDILAAFTPQYHIPTDHAVYGDDPVEKQRENARACAQGTQWMAENSPSETTIVPLIKGSTPGVRAITERGAASLQAEVVAFYGGQYETTPWTQRKATLNQDLRGIQRETGGLPVVVIGATGWRTVLDMPANVCGVAGLRRWREVVEPRSRPPAEMEAAYRRVREDVEATLAWEAAGEERHGGESDGRR